MMIYLGLKKIADSSQNCQKKNENSRLSWEKKKSKRSYKNQSSHNRLSEQEKYL